MEAMGTDVELSYWRRMLVLGICCLSILIVGLDITILNVALPALQHDLHASISGAQWTIDAYTLVLASLLMLSGSTADRVGRRRTFQLGLATFTVGSLLCSLAPSLGWLVGFRMVQAVGGSMLNPVAMSIISNVFTDGRERARAIGVWGGVVGVSIAAGPVLGGVLVDGIGWRAIFWLNVPIGVVAAALAAWFVPESKAAHARRVDPVGQVLVAATLALLVYGIIEAPDHGWGSWLTLGCFGAAAACLVGLLAYERVRDEPLIDLRFFRSAPFSGAAVIAVCAFIALGGFLFLNTLYLQDVRGYSAIQAGLCLLPMAGSMTICGPLSGRLVAALGPRPSLIAGALAVTAAAALSAVPHSDPSNLRLFSAYVLIGAGLGFLNAALTNTAVSGMPRSQAGVAAAITSTSRQVGQSLGVAVIGSVIAGHLSRVVAGPAFTDASRMSWWIITGCGLLALSVAVATTGIRGQASAERTARAIGADLHAAEAVAQPS
jgi:EmrB/QacA subfamily drug resistance transporter